MGMVWGQWERWGGGVTAHCGAHSACGAPVSNAGDWGGRGLQRETPWDLEDAGSFVSGVLTPLGPRGPGGQGAQVECRIPIPTDGAQWF